MSPIRISPVSFLRLCTEVASFYGFLSVREMARGLGRAGFGAPSFSVATQLCAARAEAQPTEPALAFYATPSPDHLPRGVSTREAGEFGLYAAGGHESAGELVILKTISAIADEWGSAVARVRLNALGDRESRERFVRELSSHFRRQAVVVDPACRGALARDPIAHRCEHETCRAAFTEGPRSVTFLSEKSRSHFKAVLEQIEGLGFSYEIDDSLLGDERGQHIIFAIDFAKPDATVVGTLGGRYDDHIKRVVTRKEGSAVSASIYFRKKGASRATFSISPPARAPRVFFVQLGPLAKLQGLAVLDLLRRARLPVSQSFDASRLSPQLMAAGVTKVSHILIMGQREALDGTIIVRTVSNGSQETIELPRLPRFLKQLRAR